MRPRQRWGVAAAVAGLLLVEVGGGWLLRSEAPRAFGSVPAVASRGAPGANDGAFVVNAAPAPVRPARAIAAPALVQLTRLGVSAQVVSVSVGSGGALGVPADPHVVGWWQDGAAPGSGRGSVVVDGHVDDARLGRGALFTLRQSRPGDAVRLRDASGRWWNYVVTGLRQYRKRGLPADDVFAQAGPERLVLVTCGGAFDRRTRQYADNVVVFAVPVNA